MTNTNKTILSIIAVIVLVLGGWYALRHKGPASGTAGAGSNDAVAIVNGESIPRSELLAAETQITTQSGAPAATTTEAVAALQTQALDSLVAQTLLKQAAVAAGMTASSTEVDAQLASVKGQFQTAAAYQQALTAQGMTEDQLKAQISDSVLIQDYVAAKLDFASVTASDAEVQAAYDQAVNGQTGAPALSDVRDQVVQMVVENKQQQLVNAEVARLKAAGSVQILI